ncbi:hypothetical protein NEMIN01_0566 [Nematocida minor]|uniref:uncharacterized protein n=1 Tax=Nematocida minor TaxID=1912983 RepID=UPI002220F70A|nr:uncharacterized protein NEMIN01_0566 [Nematocida minor]KAI5189613.1 hypothetical protein NEMIN01_0566 [Nematocida minor]
MNSDNKTQEAVSKKVQETDEKAHKQVQMMQQSKLGQMVPTQFEKVGIKQMAMVSLILNAAIYIYVYALYIALYSTKTEDSFASSVYGIILGVVYLLSFCHDLFVYYFNKSSMLLSFLGIRLLSLAVTILFVFFLTGNAATFLFKLFIVFTNILFCLMYMYIFSIYISNMKTGGSSSRGDHQEV